jgi:hypothetical protein
MLLSAIKTKVRGVSELWPSFRPDDAPLGDTAPVIFVIGINDLGPNNYELSCHDTSSRSSQQTRHWQDKASQN